MIKKILHLSIFAVLLLKPNYGKAQSQCTVPNSAQEFTGQISQNSTYKISSNQYANQIPSQIPSGVTLYITGTARIDTRIDISRASEVTVCGGGGLSVSRGGTNANLIVGPYGAVKVNDPLGDYSYNPPQLKENAVVALCGYSTQNGGKRFTKYIGDSRGTSYFIVGKTYAYNTNKSYASNKSNVTLIDYGIYNDPVRAAPIAYTGGKKFQCFPKSIAYLSVAPSRCDASFDDQDNPFYDSSDDYTTNTNNICDLTYLIENIPGYTPTPAVQHSSIEVHVLEDTNGDLVGDAILKNVTIELFDSSTGRKLNEVSTGNSGTFTFNNITPGNYRLIETDPTGYSSFSDSYHYGTYSWQRDSYPRDNKVEVTVSAGQDTFVEFLDRSNKLVCAPEGVTGQAEFLSSVVGISTLDRGNDTSWLNSVKNGQLVLDSKEKGLVLPRIANPSSINNASEGMIIYDTTDNCIKLYQNNKWDCLTKKNCITLP